MIFIILNPSCSIIVTILVERHRQRETGLCSHGCLASDEGAGDTQNCEWGWEILFTQQLGSRTHFRLVKLPKKVDKTSEKVDKTSDQKSRCIFYQDIDIGLLWAVWKLVLGFLDAEEVKLLPIRKAIEDNRKRSRIRAWGLRVSRLLLDSCPLRIYWLGRSVMQLINKAGLSQFGHLNLYLWFHNWFQECIFIKCLIFIQKSVTFASSVRREIMHFVIPSLHPSRHLKYTGEAPAVMSTMNCIGTGSGEAN